MNETSHRRARASARHAGPLLWSLVILFLLSPPAHAIGTKGGPAFHIKQNPGDPFRTPWGLAIDPVHDQVIIADTGHNRLLAFPRSQVLDNPVWTELLVDDPNDHLADGPNLGVPRAVTVDPEGRIYATHRQRRGRRPRGGVRVSNGGYRHTELVRDLQRGRDDRPPQQVSVAIFETFAIDLGRRTVDDGAFDLGAATHVSVRFESSAGWAGIDDLEVTP
jgi:hypothetical protein